MASIVKDTQSIREAVTYINAVDSSKFSRLLSRILQKLHLKGERSFSEDEEQKLQTALALEKQALHLVLETTSFLLEQAVYHNVKLPSLKQQLENIHVSPDKAEAFCQAWASAGPDMVEKIRQRIFAPKKLEHIGWQFNLQMARSSQAKLKAPHAVLDLGVQDEDKLEVKPFPLLIPVRPACRPLFTPRRCLLSHDLPGSAPAVKLMQIRARFTIPA